MPRNRPPLPQRTLCTTRRILSRRALSVGMVGALALLPLVACSDAPKPAPKPQASTCGEFLALSPKDQDRAFRNSQWTLYSASDSGEDLETEVYQEACATQASTAFLEDILNTAMHPECDDLAMLTSDVQAEWAKTIAGYFDLDSELSAESLVAACAAYPGGADTAARLIEDYPTYGAWTTTTTLGYTELITVGIGAILTSDPASNPTIDALAGEGCGYEPGKDAAIPFLVRVTNTTPDGPKVGTAAFSVNRGTDLTTSPAVENLRNDGTTCSVPDGFIGGYIDFAGTEQLMTGETLTAYYFLIVKNFFSPRYPGGAVGELAAYAVTSQRQGIADDNVVEATPLTLSFEGAAR